MATPRDWPIWRLVEAIPEATPACVAGMPDTAVNVIGAFTTPPPIPNTVNATMSGRIGEDAVSRDSRTPPAARPTPAASIGSRGPRRARIRLCIPPPSAHHPALRLPARSGRGWSRPRGSGRAPGGQRDGRDAARDVPPERAPPADGIDEQAADYRTERQGQAVRTAPDTDRPGTFGPVGEGVGDDGHRHRDEHGPAVRLHHPERDQPAQAGRQAAQPRSRGEHRKADLEDPAAADPVGGRAGQHQETGEHERVAVDGPLQPGY